MAIEYLKRGKSDADRAEDDAKTRAVVEATLKDIETRGDAAVRELSEKFDNYSPASFRLSQQEIDDLICQLTERELLVLGLRADTRYEDRPLRCRAHTSTSREICACVFRGELPASAIPTDPALTRTTGNEPLELHAALLANRE